MLETPHLKLVPANQELSAADLVSCSELATMLGAHVPINWPPEIMQDALPWFHRQLSENPDQVGWYTWYAISTERIPILVASGGFMGPPSEGIVETGYSVLPQYLGRGFATEMMRALLAWAFKAPAVELIVAEVEKQNASSIRVLQKLGFSVAGPGREKGTLRYECRDGSFRQ